MQEERLYFFNLKWRNYSRWQVALIGIAPVAVICGIIWIVEPSWLHYAVVAAYFVWTIYAIWSMTRKNSLHWIKNDSCKLKIEGVKLELDLKLLSEVWIENEELHIRRINRVDSFPVDHLREEDVLKLKAILKEYEPQIAQ